MTTSPRRTLRYAQGKFWPRQFSIGQDGRNKDWVIRELGTLREGWDTLEADETHLLRRPTVHESIRQWPIRWRMSSISAIWSPTFNTGFRHDMGC